jgi:regulator of replication initiation timing
MQPDSDKTPKEIVNELYQMFSSFKQRMEDPNYIQLENTLNQLVENQMEMKMEMKELKRQLLNPFDGVIVETKRNKEYITKLEEKEDEWAEVLEEHRALVRWKGNVTRFGLGIIGAMGAVISFLLNKFLGE